MLHGAVQQFFRDVRWERDRLSHRGHAARYGDVALSLSQSVPVAGAVLVTTPQSVAVADTRRAVSRCTAS
jgi:ATP-binding protein involved in chromosome partitioning